MADVSDGEGAPEELTLVEGRDAAETTRKQEQDNEKRLVSEAKVKKRRQDERNREAKLKKSEKKKKRLEDAQGRQEEEDDSDLDAGVLAMKNSGFLDESIVQFLVDKERKEATTGCQPQQHQDVDTRPRRKAKRKSSSGISIDERTKLVMLNDSQTHARRGSEFFKQRLHGSHIQRSTVMLKPQKKVF